MQGRGSADIKERRLRRGKEARAWAKEGRSRRREEKEAKEEVRSPLIHVACLDRAD
jgi:hypothetical protein